jgi:hypothetical protein
MYKLLMYYRDARTMQFSSPTKCPLIYMKKQQVPCFSFLNFCSCFRSSYLAYSFTTIIQIYYSYCVSPIFSCPLCAFTTHGTIQNYVRSNDQDSSHIFSLTQKLRGVRRVRVPSLQCGRDIRKVVTTRRRQVLVVDEMVGNFLAREAVEGTGGRMSVHGIVWAVCVCVCVRRTITSKYVSSIGMFGSKNRRGDDATEHANSHILEKVFNARTHTYQTYLPERDHFRSGYSNDGPS